MFNKILIANRGEIAVRIIRACREMGVSSVVAYSEADASSMPVRLADEAVCIGPKESAKSYLSIPALISAAEVAHCDAIHPGFGFLSENAGFAEVCESCNISFIGPSSDVIKLMGNKIAAKATAKRAGVPTVPGSDGPIENEEQLLETAKVVEYPLILKAASGGGGRGMRVVNKESELKEAFSLVKAEAAACFGDDTIYMERFVVNPRHIEVQLLGDKHGNVVHLYERDCSVQRRHQKLIEECPASILSDEAREDICKRAVSLAKEIGYYSAGTIEFLYDDRGEFYFMEMNTRLQVEHPVTEMVTGIDLIKAQIRVADGQKLHVTQEDISINGHSIECRVNAEDPDSFIPSPGKVGELFMPGGPGVRVDSALYAGYSVPPYYDSMIAKIIVHASNRKNAIARMARALGEFHVTGIKTSVPLHLRVLKNDRFKNGDATISFLEEMLEQE